MLVSGLAPWVLESELAAPSVMLTLHFLYGLWCSDTSSSLGAPWAQPDQDLLPSAERVFPEA